MLRNETGVIRRWSTNDVAPADRIDYWTERLSSAFVPLAVGIADPLNFESEMGSASLGSVNVLKHRGSAHTCFRTRSELSRSSEHGFNLVLLLSGAWNVTNRGDMRVRAGDLMVHDSLYPSHSATQTRFSCVNLQLSPSFLREWLPNPAWLVGRTISRDSQWGRVLASYIAQLSPEFVVQAPLPQSVLVDQIGSLLALTAMELGNGEVRRTLARSSLCEQIRDQVKQRSPRSSLQAADIARSLNISTRTLHRALAACGETFGALLIQSRVDVAMRMLGSPLFDRVTTAEIGRRAGFSDASHFTRVLRRHTGQTPMRVRRVHLSG